MSIDPLLRWLEGTPAGNRVHSALNEFAERTATHFATVGSAGDEIRQVLTEQLVAGGAILELVRQLVVEERADPEGLRLVGSFLFRYPELRERLLQQKFQDPNQAEAVHSIIARAQAAASD